MQEAVARRRGLTDRLLDAAREALEEAGRGSSRSTLDAVEATLVAAAADPEAARRVLEGRLDKPLPAGGGMEGLLALASPAERPARPARSARSRSGPAGRRALRLGEEAKAAEDLAARLDRDARARRQAAERMKRDAMRATRAAELAAQEAERAARRAATLRRKALEAAAG